MVQPPVKKQLGFEVETTGCAALPSSSVPFPVTADIQLLSLVQVEDGFDKGFEIAHESVSMNGHWQPFDGMKTFPQGNGHRYHHAEPLKEVGLFEGNGQNG